MSSPETQGRFLPMTPESRRAATKAAQAAGMPLSDWLSELIKSAGQIAQRENVAPPAQSPADPEPDVVAAPIAPLPADAREAVQFPPEDEPSENEDGATMVPANALRPSTICPEPEPDETEIRLIHRMLVEVGTFRPIIVRPTDGVLPMSAGGTDTIYEIISGEQRWRAALRARMAEVPVEIRTCSDREAQVLAMCESLKRYAIPPIEEAEAYGRLKDEFELSVEAIAEAVDKSVEHVSQMTRLLWLPASVRQMIEDDRLTVPHARILLDADDPEASAHEVLNRGLDIYRTEQMVRNQRAKAARATDGTDVPARAEQ